MLIDGTPGSSYCPHLLSLFSLTPSLFTIISHLHVRDSIDFAYLIPTADKLKNIGNGVLQAHLIILTLEKEPST
jgi:hypothetical protein